MKEVVIESYSDFNDVLSFLESKFYFEDWDRAEIISTPDGRYRVAIENTYDPDQMELDIG
mgnify:CR=1 FL=1